MKLSDIEKGFVEMPVPEGEKFQRYFECDIGREYKYCKAILSTKVSGRQKGKENVKYWRSKWPYNKTDTLEDLREILACGPCNECERKYGCAHSDQW